VTTRTFTQSAESIEPAGVRAVLFDVDGTLYSQGRLRTVMAAELARAALKEPRRIGRVIRIIKSFRQSREELRALGDRAGSLEQLQYAAVADRLNVDVGEVREAIEEWMFVRPLPYLHSARRSGLDALLTGLEERGIRVGALSDYPARAKLDALDVARHFSLSLCTTDRSINAFKPHPRGYLAACELWGLAPQEVLYVGDRPEVDAVGAAAAGTRCVIIGSGHGFTDLARSVLAR
jgi:phosphoglycolate phosphatase/putative hydrolase of the HAD superfamily